MSELPLRKGELVQTASSEGWAIYQSDTDSVHVLNASARAIWELCDGKTSADEMALAIVELTGLDFDRAKKDVTQTLATLSQLGLTTDHVQQE